MHTITEVLARLVEIIEQEKRRNSAAGMFPALYYAMTAAVLKDIQTGQFENPSLMEQLDVHFAKRYFAAYDAWRSGQSHPRSWSAAFEASANDQLIVMQHLMLGINAHINFDLSISAAAVAPGNAIFAMERDFMRINDIIGNLTETVQDKLGRIWQPLGIFDHLLRTKDEGLANFSINVARRAAWVAATHLAFLEGHLKETYIQTLDESVASFARKITQPGSLLAFTLPTIRKCEQGTIAGKIDLLLE